MRIPVSAVLLDLDGTLLDHDGAAHAAFLSARAVWLAETDRFTWDAADALFAVYLKEYEASWRAFDDVPEAMRFLHQAPGGVAVLSNGDRRQQEAKVAALDLDPVPRLFVPADVGAAKPEPGSFLGACAAMGWNPAEVVYVGDNLTTDVVAARSAGLTGCWLQRRPANGHLAEPSIPRVATLLDLPRILRWAVPGATGLGDHDRRPPGGGRDRQPCIHRAEAAEHRV